MTVGGGLNIMGNTQDGTLLAHLAWSLSSRHEDLAVETLGFILKSTSARRSLVQLVNEGGADIGEIRSVRTQVGGADQTRPDLVGYGGDGSECLLMEAKFWAGLTSNQPNAYLERLPQRKVLLFIAPISRIATLWAELCRLSGASRSLPITKGEDFKSAVSRKDETDYKHLMLISWTYVLDCLENSDESDMLTEIKQLRGFVNRVDETGFPPLGTEEFAPVFPRRLLGLMKLIDDASEISAKEEYADTKGLKTTPRYQGYGRYMRLAGAVVWFGIDSYRWAGGRFPDTPLWLLFEQWKSEDIGDLERTRKALEPLECREPPACFDEVDTVLVPIHLPVGVEYQVVVHPKMGQPVKLQF